jgi:asparagine synthase (glutamine-hydrolysing)
MAERLKHRCHGGWEKAESTLNSGTMIAVGHGRAPWQCQPQIAQNPSSLLAHTGVFFVDGAPLQQLLAGVSSAPEQQLPRLEGAFTLALAAGDKFYLLRDHAGVKVIYWTLFQGRLLFASEIKALFAYPGLPRTLRPGALLEYFSFSFVPGSGTMFENIQELQPGTLLTFHRGRVTLQRHFQFEQQESQTATAAQNYPDIMRTALEAAVSDCRRAVSATPGVFISGGIDSSAVLALAARQQPETPLPTFSVHFGAEYPNENDFIRLMIERYRTRHHWLELRPHQFLPQLQEIIWKLDDPIGDPVTLPNYLMAEAAAAVTPLMLNGEGGDPCLGGPKNIPMLLAQLYGPAPQETPQHWLERQYLRSFQRCYDDLQQLIDPEILKQAGGIDALIGILEPFFQAERPRHFLNKLMSINIRLKGANLILAKVDKMSSANGILALPPLFSRRIIETGMACPPALKLAGAVEKHILKQAVLDCVPAAIIGRPKSGMRVPVSLWFRGELRQYAEHLLSTRNLQRNGLLHPAYVQRLLAYETSGVPGQRHGLKLWMLLTFLLWYEQMVEVSH